MLPQVATAMTEGGHNRQSPRVESKLNWESLRQVEANEVGRNQNYFSYTLLIRFETDLSEMLILEEPPETKLNRIEYEWR